MSARYHTITELIEIFGNNSTILDAVIKTEDHINTAAREGGKIMVSISGGSDSDIVLDLFEALGYDPGTVVYVWFDTGLEYEATKRHLVYLENRYGIEINRCRAEKTVARVVKEYGVPFLAKQCSEYIERLQLHGFTWRKETLVVLENEIKRCHSALRFWTNDFGAKSSFNISAFTGLQEFMIQNHPPKISNKCCHYAKKQVAKKALVIFNATLNVTGMRRAESGARSTRYSSCFSRAENGVDSFRPIFYFSDADKAEYEAKRNIRHSDCYEVWGFKRTGCACCPFGSGFEEELKIAEKYEPNLYKAVCKIFGPSYEYTRKYRKFKESFKREKRRGRQINLFDRWDKIESKEDNRA